MVYEEAIRGHRRLPPSRGRDTGASPMPDPVSGQTDLRREKDAAPRSATPIPSAANPTRMFSVVREPVVGSTSSAGRNESLRVTTLSATWVRKPGLFGSTTLGLLGGGTVGACTGGAAFGGTAPRRAWPLEMIFQATRAEPTLPVEPMALMTTSWLPTVSPEYRAGESHSSGAPLSRVQVTVGALSS